MKCMYDIVLISRYMEKELTSQEMNEVEAHLKQCRVCSKELERLQTALTIMKSVREVEMPRDYVESATRKLKE
jgi:predicted anti-sigma-YlaC factor YlaD